MHNPCRLLIRMRLPLALALLRCDALHARQRPCVPVRAVRCGQRAVHQLFGMLRRRHRQRPSHVLTTSKLVHSGSRCSRCSRRSRSSALLRDGLHAGKGACVPERAARCCERAINQLLRVLSRRHQQRALDILPSLQLVHHARAQRRQRAARHVVSLHLRERPSGGLARVELPRIILHLRRPPVVMHRRHPPAVAAHVAHEEAAPGVLRVVGKLRAQHTVRRHVIWTRL
mmetsp:Transcript_20002/g.40746  ORF Transcript_20002/g.40746 Transcript_20002/m.40746 type:complete len:229 (-) Transcript_20002:828-1514(-)